MASRRLASKLFSCSNSGIAHQLGKTGSKAAISDGALGLSQMASRSSSTQTRSIATALLQSVSSSHRGMLVPMGMAALGHQMQARMPASADMVFPCVSLSSSTSTALPTASPGSSVSGEVLCTEDDEEGVIARRKRKLLGRTCSYSSLLGPLRQPQHPHGPLLVKSISSSCLASSGAAATVRVSPVRESSSHQEPPGVATQADASSRVGSVEAFMKQHDVKVFSPSGNMPLPVLTFQEAGFPAAINKTIQRLGFGEPTPIQCQAWPVALSKQDLVAIASTGSGKTAAYLLPALARIFTGDLHTLTPDPAQPQRPARGNSSYRAPKPYQGPLTLVLAPTRELARQIQEQAHLFGRPLGIESMAVYGGVSKMGQVQTLRTSRPQVLVATPGRLLDLHEEMAINLSNVQYLVMDEADRMLDMGFEDDIRRVVSHLPASPTRQTLFFSATWPQEVRSLARDLAGNEPVTVFLGNVSKQAVAARTITQEVQLVEGSAPKMRALQQYLMQQLQEQQGEQEQEQQELGRHRGMQARLRTPSGNVFRAIIFTGTKVKANTLTDWLSNQRDLPHAVAVHGDLSQAQRERAIQDFRSGRAGILVATDVAARGLDVPNVNLVINFDVPKVGNAEDYVHRIGRTGRAGAQGRSLALINTHRKEDIEFCSPLIKIMKEAGQAVSPELEDLLAASAPRGFKKNVYGGHHRHADRGWSRGRDDYRQGGGRHSGYGGRGNSRGQGRDYDRHNEW